MYIIDTSKLIEIFCEVDDFCQVLPQQVLAHPVPGLVMAAQPAKTPVLYPSEIMTLLIFYQLSGFKCFQYFYEKLVLGGPLLAYFPKAVSYHRFIELLPRALIHMFLFAHYKAGQAERSGVYYIDTKKLPVCHNRRIHQNRVFEGVAQRGKSSTGWFYGLKLHLVTNHLGQMVNFAITPANVADNNQKMLAFLLSPLKGKCFGDKGYISALFEWLLENGLQLITKIRKNMKNALMTMTDKLLLNKRAVIESVNDILMTVCDIEHTRHRSPLNALTHILAALIGYSFLDATPSIFSKTRLLK